MKKNRQSLFIENFIVYGFGTVVSSIIPFIMLPFLTRLYPNPSYIGLNDNVNILVSFFSQLIILGILDIMFLFYFENSDQNYRKELTSSALKTVLYSGSIVVAILVLLCKPLSALLFASSEYFLLILIGATTTFVSCISNVICAPTRMNNERGRFVIINCLASIISYGIAIPLLLAGWYLYAMPLAAMFSKIIVCIIFYILNHKYFDFTKANKTHSKGMLKLGIPGMPAHIFYWVLTSAQRIIITNMLGLGSAGIYAIGAKLATISQLIYLAFASGWQYFAFSTMKDKEHTELISRIFDYLAGISFFTACMMVLVSKTTFRVLFDATYALGAYTMPALFLAPLIQMLFQCIASQFTIIKKTWISPVCLAFGALLSLMLDYTLIPIIGIRGGAIAELAGFCVACLILAILLCRKNLLKVSPRIIISATIAILAVVTFTLNVPAYICMTLSILGSILIFILYRKDSVAFIKTSILRYGKNNKSLSEEYK